MKIKLIILLAFTLVSCAKETQHQTVSHQEADVMVDIRVFPEDQARVNGQMISASALDSHIQNLRVSEDTRARILFDENVSFRVITKTQKLLSMMGVERMYAKGFTTEEFKNYDEHVIHIDILHADKLLFEGIPLHTADLPIALDNKEIDENAEFILTVSDEATFGAVYDVQKSLAVNGLKKVSTQDLPEYQY